MASPSLVRAPQCISCVRRITRTLYDAGPGRHQVRGKKKIAKVTTVNVHLLQNVPGYGRKGAVIPVTTGVMRNIWYPKQIAEYVTPVVAQEIGLRKDTLIEREYTFKSERERKLERQIQQEEQAEREREAKEAAEAEEAAQAQEAEWEVKGTPAQKDPAPKIEIDLLSPDETVSILEEILPANLDFYRSPIDLGPVKKVSPSIAPRAVVSTADKTQASASGKTSIYGSVSTSDIAVHLKDILAENENGSRVVLNAEDISFVEETADADRVKHLGVFEVEIKVEGASDSVRRTIKISARD